jgi:hypothetical protein
MGRMGKTRKQREADRKQSDRFYDMKKTETKYSSETSVYFQLTVEGNCNIVPVLNYLRTTL